MAITGLKNNPASRQFAATRSQLEELQRQLSTGLKATTYGGLGAERSMAITFQSRVTDLESYQATTNQVQLRMKLLDTSMTRLTKIPTDIKATLDPNNFVLRLDNRTDAQKSARIALDEVVGLLNSEADGRYLFSGKSTSTKPVIDVNRLLEGEGAKDGLRQVTAERLEADLGTNKMGRLDLSTAGTAVSVNRQTPLSAEFGFKIADAETSSAGISVSLAGGAPVTGATFNVTGAVNAGETVTLELTNPDGTASKVTLKATNSNPPGTGEFLIGANGAATAANLQSALGTALTRTAKTDLAAASAIKAGENFFDTFGGAVPQRVDTTSGGGSLATATTLRDATADDTVVWYSGFNGAIDTSDPSTLPRSDSVAQVDRGVEVGYGARANEDGFRVMVQSLAVTAVATFSASEEADGDRYRALTERARDLLTFGDGKQSPSDIHAEMALAGTVANGAASRHAVTKSTIQEMLDGVEGVSKEEVVAQILTLQTRMQASYQTSAILNQLSLVNYI